MSILARANERDYESSEWVALPEALWRMRVGTPAVVMNERWGKYEVRFPLTLTPDEQERCARDYPVANGVNQSWRSNYKAGLSLGWMKDGQYQSTKLIDFLCAVLGTENGRKFRKWIEAGNGPPRPEDRDDAEAEIACIQTWLGWWEDLEVYGTISHSTGNDGRIWANFAGPMPVGSLPGQPEPDYQALCRGKLRAMIAEAEGADTPAITTAKIKEEVATARAAAQAADDDDIAF